MDEAARYEWLTQLGRIYGSGLRGKILQRLLELAFARVGFRLVDERISEGIDFDVVRRNNPSERYSFEARTTEEYCVPVKTEDFIQMKARESDGYDTGIAALRISPGSSWIFVKSRWLLSPSLRVSVGTSSGWENLAQQVNQGFDGVLEDLGPLAIREGLEALKKAVDDARL